MSSLLAWVATYFVHSTILVLGAYLLERLWHDRPERMSAVWKVALVGGVATASLQLVLCISPVAGVWDVAPEAPASVAPVLAADASEPDVSASSRALAVLEPSDAWTERGGATHEAVTFEFPTGAAVEEAGRPPDQETDHTLASGASAPATPSAPGGAGGASWLGAAAPWIVAAITLGAVMGLFSVIAAFVVLRLQLRGRQSLREGPLRSQLERLRGAAGIERQIPLTLAPKIRTPMAVGILRPEIVVPHQAAHALSASHQEGLLAHELAHLVRRDPLWRLIGLLAQRVLFFQPFNRLASARVSTLAEYLCDDWAARHTQHPLELAGCLTEIADWVAHPSAIAAPMVGPRSILGQRVHRLLRPAGLRERPSWLPLALGLPLVAVLFAAPSVSARRVVTQEPSEEVEPATARPTLVAYDDTGISLVDSSRGLPVVIASAEPQAPRARKRKKARKSDPPVRIQAKKPKRPAKKKRKAQPAKRQRPAKLHGDAHIVIRSDDGKSEHSDHVEVRVITPKAGSSTDAQLVLELKTLAALARLEDLSELKSLHVEVQHGIELVEAFEDGRIEVIIDTADETVVIEIDSEHGGAVRVHSRTRKRKHRAKRKRGAKRKAPAKRRARRRSP